MKTLKAGLSVIIISISFISMSTYKASAATFPAISRDKAESRALKIINLSWKYSSAKNSKISSKYTKSVTLPKQFTGIKSAASTGIPYNWGGLDGIDTHSYNTPWTNFLDAVNKGAFTGNVSTSSSTGYIAGTAGMDCSGFVQAVYNISSTRLTSSNILDSYFQKIALKDIKHMDILDKPGSHVAIFDSWGTLNGVDGAFTYESTPDQTYGGIQGTKKYFMSLTYLTEKGYIPCRYVNLSDDTDTDIPSTKYQIGGYAIISKNKASFKSTADKKYTVLASIPKNTVFYLMNYSNGLYKVSYNNTVGWIDENSLSSVPKNKYVVITGASGVNIRKSASTASTVLGIFSENQYASKIDESKDGYWYKVTVNGITGWCYKKYLAYIK